MRASEEDGEAAGYGCWAGGVNMIFSAVLPVREPCSKVGSLARANA